MSLSLYLLNLKLSRLALLGWCLVLGFYAILVVYLYSSIRDADDLVAHLIELPLQVRSAIGLSQETMESVFPDGQLSFDGALATNYLVWWPIFVGIYAIIFGTGTVAREAEQGVLGTLMYQPLRRYKFLLSKSAAYVSILIALGVISWGAVAAAVVVVDIQASTTNIALAHAMGILLVLAIFSYSMLISSLFLHPRSALAIAYVITFASYMLYFMLPSFDSVDWLAKGSIFYYYQPFRSIKGRRSELGRDWGLQWNHNRFSPGFRNSLPA